MKIISCGNRKKWSFRIRCPECKSKLMISKKDLHAINTAKGYLGETWEPEIKATCVVCKKILIISDDVPNSIKSDLYNRLRKLIKAKRY